MQVLDLEVSEVTHERRELLVVGTATVLGQHEATQGRILVFDIIEVVPDPDRPNTDRKLKIIAEEEMKGAVTALSRIGNQGLMLAAQGQKCMVRGLKEDGSLLPVAFIDLQCYISVAKELKGTGFCLMGDAMKGISFAGYSVSDFHDPFRSFSGFKLI